MATITMNKLAIRKLTEALQEEAQQDLFVRVYVEHVHGDHAHYGVRVDHKSAGDDIVDVDGLQVLVERKALEWLDGLEVKFLLYPQEGWKITNPTRNNHGDH